MVRRNPARFLAPVTLLVVVAAVFVVVRGSHSAHHGADARSTPPAASGGHGHGRGHTGPPARVYVVREGDILSAISGRTGISVPTLQSLNPKLDPQSLHAGQRLKLRP